MITASKRRTNFFALVLTLLLPSASVRTALAGDAPGQGFAHVLALTWAPSFCASVRRQPPPLECRPENLAQQYGFYNLTLHGLWPNRAPGDTSYGFCGNPPPQSRDFCAYEPVVLSDDFWLRFSPQTEFDGPYRFIPSEEFDRNRFYHPLMPGSMSCLERYEYSKHGTCTGLNPEMYLTVALWLTRFANDAPSARFISDNKGREVQASELCDKLRAEGWAEGEFIIHHGRGRLAEVFYSIEREVPAGLAQMIASGQAAAQPLSAFKGPRMWDSSNCQGSFLIP